MNMPQVVITGFGSVNPLGLTAEQMWDGICNGKCGIKTVSAFDASKFKCQLAGEVAEFSIRDYVPKSHRKATKLMSRDIELSVIAAREAVQSAGLVTKDAESGETNIEPLMTAINFGAGLISADLDELAAAVGTSITDGKFDMHKWGAEGMNALTPLWLLKYLPNMLACHIGIIHDMQGPSNTITCGEVSSHIAIIEASQVIQRGQAQLALAGGGEAKVTPVVLMRQILLDRAMFSSNDNPQGACRPFDSKAGGSVFGEAAGVIVLEDADRAKNRNAKILAVVAGTGQSNSLNPVLHQLEPSGQAIKIAIEKALKEAKISPADIDLIVPHGTGIPCDDAAEAKGIQDALGEAVKNIAVLPIKSMVSNAGAASGSLDVIAAVCAMRDSVIPAAKNFDGPIAGCKLKINTKKIEKKIRYALCTGYTFGGQTAAVVLKNYNG
jgi:3-oxoacyl-[acyl-carrier-protein] synthase II